MVNPLQQTIRTITVFFSIVVALGLKQPLTPDFHKTFPYDGWLCFAAALLLALRFLFGSANHLWKEFSDQALLKPNSPFEWGMVWSLLWHLLCLIVIGLLVVWTCFAQDVLEFLGRNIVFAVVAAILSALVTIPNVSKGKGMFRATWSANWTLICVAHAIAAWGALCWFVRESGGTATAGFSLSLAVFALVLLLLLAVDLAFQTWKMAQP
jgi:predicted lysophospholipase L1 biosynthesis ABC-type transport system permease subunit